MRPCYAPGTFRCDATITEEEEARAAAAGGRAKRAYVHRIFSEIAPRYDLLNHVLSANIDRDWRRRAIAALAWERDPRGTYVDLCAGTLDVGAAIARSAGFAGQVIGADFAEPMLRAGAAKTRGLPVRPVVADALRLPLADDELRGVIVAFGIRNVDDLDAGLREMLRVTGTGGRFVMLEFSTPRAAARARPLPFLFPPHPAGDRTTRERAQNGLPVPAGVRRQLSRRRRARAAHARRRDRERAVGAAHLRHRRDPRRRARRMSIDTISDFIEAIDAIGELVRVAQPVRAELEICEIADRVMKQPGGGPALLFEHVHARRTARARRIPWPSISSAR